MWPFVSPVLRFGSSLRPRARPSWKACQECARSCDDLNQRIRETFRIRCRIEKGDGFKRSKPGARRIRVASTSFRDDKRRSNQVESGRGRTRVFARDLLIGREPRRPEIGARKGSLRRMLRCTRWASPDRPHDSTGPDCSMPARVSSRIAAIRRAVSMKCWTSSSRSGRLRTVCSR